MVELTHGGTWLNWSSLGRVDRRWALLSFITAGVAAIPIGLILGEWGHEIGYRLGSGGQTPPKSMSSELFAPEIWSYLMLASAIMAVVSAFAWWRFSRNQDEMFNRIQNFALAQAGGWTLAIVTLWWLLSLGGWIAPLPLGAIFGTGFVLLLGFWFYAVRRWA